MVLFTSSDKGTIGAMVVPGSWTDVSVRVLVPEGASDGPVAVRRNGRTGTGIDFRLAPRLVAYGADLVPIFQQRGCASCHGGSGGLTVIPRSALLIGGSHGAVVVPRRSAESNLVRKLGANPPFGERMPRGGPPLSAAEIQLIADWIDQGAREDVVPPPPPPEIDELVPGRTVVGDTVRIAGSGFGGDPLVGSVRFTAAGGGTIAATIVPGGWSDALIVALVPDGAAAGSVLVVRDGEESAGVRFDLATALVSYANDLLPLFHDRGCESCHGGQNNLFVTPHSALMAGGSDHGPAVRPRRSGQSLLVQILGDSPPFGLPRMPLGSPALSPAQVRLISDWIDQGARDN
jgi:hypothetical protein